MRYANIIGYEPECRQCFEITTWERSLDQRNFFPVFTCRAIEKNETYGGIKTESGPSWSEAGHFNSGTSESWCIKYDGKRFRHIGDSK